jgi:hypothetical protein
MAFKARMFYPQQEEEEYPPPFRSEAVMPEPQRLGLFDGGGAQDLFRKAITDSAPALSSTSDPSTNGPLTHEHLVENGGAAGKTTYAKLWGGDQVSPAETEMDTARKELGSFSDSAGKWWSVLLAAMFPQYGQALNMMESFKRNKYMAARDKYNAAMEAAMKEHSQKPMNISGMPGWMMINGQAVKVASDPSRKETRYVWSDTNRLPMAVQVPEGGDPNVPDPNWTGEGPPAPVTSYDPQVLRSLVDMQGKNFRMVEEAANAERAAQAKYAHQERMKNLDRDTRLLVGELAKAGYSWINSTDIANINKEIGDNPDNIGLLEPQLRRLRERKIQELVEAKKANAVIPSQQMQGQAPAPVAAPAGRTVYKPNFGK